jgi:flagellar basal body-associated protein FliL
MNGKMKFIIPIVLLVVVGGVYKFVLAKPKAAEAKPKVEGAVYVLPKEFVVNLADGRYAKFNIALVMKHGALTAAPAAGGHAAAAEPPEGYGTLPQEALVRSIVIDNVTDVSGKVLIGEKGREKLKKKIVKTLHEHTDVEAEDVLFTDVAVQ